MLGWAKPVPTNPRNYRNYKRGDILVSIAGVCANAILAVFFAILAFLLVRVIGPVLPPASVETAWIVLQMILYGVVGNVGLIIFNLLPIPPLDGSHVLVHFLSPRGVETYRQFLPYGMIVLWGLVLTGAIRVISPVIRGISTVLLLPAGIAV
ncbi:MAG: FIG004556: membrane metalloprotease [uncultured Gemmatimonadetes bacterium]|uniref:FIG004556: membrane metalloprotease n=1 Tax=uncultured Gemmatimonadota bacterium TaxID=203437 RepID=A0A6J4KRE6_9BACT|nr:MAG: FIG004556: membrane metalloprotease [uncultured Gemmatimonadota bacterium]